MLKLKIFFIALWNIWFYFLAGFGVVLLFPVLLIAVSREKWYPALFYLAKYLWSPIITFGMGFIPKIGISPCFDFGKRYVFVANHLSMIDIMLVLIAIPKPFVFVGKIELKKFPFFATIYRKAAILVNRDSYKSRKDVYKQAKRKLSLGYNIMIYPEGTVPDPHVFLGPFKNGAFSIAIEHQIPIVPITMPDNKKRFPFQFDYKYWVGKPGIARCNIHKPVPTTGLTKEELPELKKKIYTVMSDALKEEGYC